VSRETVQNMVDEVNAIYPPAKLKYEDISFFHAGLLPRQSEPESAAIQMEKNSTFFEHKENDFHRVLSVKGVKYTTAPWVAHEITDFLKKQYPPEKSKGIEQKALGIGRQSTEESALYMSLRKKYGKRAGEIYSLIEQQENIWLDETSGLLKAEVHYLVEEEMVCKLADIIFRRTGLGSADCPPRILLEKIAAFTGEILGWDKARQEQEIDEVLLRYSPLVGHES
jgi:glycerol-3-phosphate dehydrogenase